MNVCKIAVCKACGNTFELKSNHTKWCEGCRHNEYKKYKRAYYEKYGEKYREKKRQKTQMAKVVRKQEWILKYKEILLMREQGMTFKEIGEKLGCTKQYIHQVYTILKKEN
ncbi:MAG: hypothetical protein ABIJ26_07725 [Candidatus Margulisiibacteriota bacterium]|uniref:Putative sigma-70 region domain containing protein n=1 Tax=viral metagenome TaxID=1070528 RepID=A0A6H1Z9X3_9ZZZZ